MKTNASIENSRSAICEALNALGGKSGQPFGREYQLAAARRFMVFALTEMDSFRHGPLQQCNQCGQEDELHGP